MDIIEFRGAQMHEEDGKREYVSVGPVAVNVDQIVAYYDHTILSANNKIRIMETYEEIKAKLHIFP